MPNNLESESLVIEKAARDPAFRKQLLADPVRTLRGAGVEVPEGVSVRIIEDTATLVHVVLPALVADESTLAESDLEIVAGGCNGTKFQTGCRVG